MRTIRCTTGEDTIVDDWNYDYFNQWSWYTTNSRHVRRSTQEGTAYLHREVLRRAGHTDFGVGDHINRNPLDNREVNLRPATCSQNNQNHGIRSDNMSSLIGVSRRRGKWQAYAGSNSRAIHLGYFDNKKQAGKARDVGAIYFHDPDFVVLNFKRSNYPSGHPDTWSPGPFLDVIRGCQRQQNTQSCNSVTGYWNVRWDARNQAWCAIMSVNGKTTYLGLFKDSPGESAALLAAVKATDAAAIALGRDKINLGREHYPVGPPRDWPEDAIPDCPALKRLIGD